VQLGITTVLSNASSALLRKPRLDISRVCEQSAVRLNRSGWHELFEQASNYRFTGGCLGSSPNYRGRRLMPIAGAIAVSSKVGCSSGSGIWWWRWCCMACEAVRLGRAHLSTHWADLDLVLPKIPTWRKRSAAWARPTRREAFGQIRAHGCRI